MALSAATFPPHLLARLALIREKFLSDPLPLWDHKKMTPITEDVVQTLIDRLQTSEREAAERLQASKKKPGGMTARIVKLGRNAGLTSGSTEKSAKVLNMSAARVTRRASKTMSGLYVYLANP